MDFRATPENVTTLLMVAGAIFVLIHLAKNRMDSNIPLLFYLGLIVFANFTDRQVNTYLFAAGLALALFLRFEFMNNLVTKMALMLEMVAVCAIAWSFFGQVFGLTVYW